MKIFKLMSILAIAFMISACSISMDTIKYAGDTDKELQTAPCAVVSIVEEVAPVPAAAPITITKIREAILFPFDSAELLPAELEKINTIADMLKAYPDTYIVINGWASSEGPKLYNSKLSGHRAIAVKSALIERGIIEERIDAVAKGETGLFGDLLKLNRRAIVLDVK